MQIPVVILQEFDVKVITEALALVCAGISMGLFLAGVRSMTKKVDNHGTILRMLGQDMHQLYQYMVTGDRSVLEQGYHRQLEDRKREQRKRGVSIYDS